jgi:hypothetical protein
VIEYGDVKCIVHEWNAWLMTYAFADDDP